ncbi:Actin-like protein 6A, partial [Zancudomyces culisetae]
ASVVCFTSSVANLQDTAGEGQDSEIKPENYNEKRTDLGLTFGSKKRKTQLRATERNIIDVAEIKNSENSITTAVESRAAETADLDSAAGETGLENEVDRPIPVHNLEETQVPRVYDPKDYSPNNITRNCPTSQLVETGGDLEQLVKLLKVDSKITKYCKDKLLCYSAVLMLSLNDWKIDVSYFAREFGLKPSVATDYLRTIGCRLQAGSSSADSGSLFTTSSTIVNNLTNTDIDNVNENENENNDDDATQNSQTANAATAGLVAGGVGQGSVAILVAPLKFPSISKRKHEVNALVFDIGTCWTRAGFAGDDSPMAYFSTLVGAISDSSTPASGPKSPTKQQQRQNGSDVIKTEETNDQTMMEVENLNNGSLDSSAPPVAETNSSGKHTRLYPDALGLDAFRANMEIRKIFSDGIVTDWEAYESLIDYIYNTKLRVRSEEHPILVSEVAWNSNEAREKLTEIFFEKYNVPGFYLAKDAVLSTFGVGKSTALVIDSGAEFTSVVPVYDGYALKKGVVKQSIGGNFVSEQILDYLKQHYDYEVRSVFEVKSKQPVEAGEKPIFQLRKFEDVTSSYRKQMQLRTIADYKESICQVFEATYDENFASTRGTKAYEFPDGFNMVIGPERFKFPEVMFQPKICYNEGSEDSSSIITQDTKSIQQLAQNSIMNCDVDLRPHLLNNITLTGGNTLFPGFVERLNLELSKLFQAVSFIFYYPIPNTQYSLSISHHLPFIILY